MANYKNIEVRSPKGLLGGTGADLELDITKTSETPYKKKSTLYQKYQTQAKNSQDSQNFDFDEKMNCGDEE